MKIKAKPGDFRVKELLDESYLRPKGRFQVYRVTKRKLTTLEAAARLAEEAGVAPAEVGIAGLKDRQGITTQYMSVAKGRTVRLSTDLLTVEPIGFASEPLASGFSSGNAFEITLRALRRAELAALEAELTDVRENGLVDYFGEQRFGNLRHNQGWIARDLALGLHERALRALLGSPAERDDARNRSFKAALNAQWGDWRACREIAGRFGAHHSVFEHLSRRRDDFAGAFEFVSSRIRLIHLYAWQSHVWNRAVARYVERVTIPERRIEVPAAEGRLYFSRGPLAVDPSFENRFRLPGPRLADVAHPVQRELFVEVLAREGLLPEQFSIEGVPGFQLKGEDRELVIRPRELRLSEAEIEPQGGLARIRVRFELPRGAYATLLIDRLTASGRARPEGRKGRRPHEERASSQRSGPRREAPRGEQGRQDAHPRREPGRGDGRRDAASGPARTARAAGPHGRSKRPGPKRRDKR